VPSANSKSGHFPVDIPHWLPGNQRTVSPTTMAAHVRTPGSAASSMPSIQRSARVWKEYSPCSVPRFGLASQFIAAPWRRDNLRLRRRASRTRAKGLRRLKAFEMLAPEARSAVVSPRSCQRASARRLLGRATVSPPCTRRSRLPPRWRSDPPAGQLAQVGEQGLAEAFFAPLRGGLAHQARIKIEICSTT